MVVVLMGVCGCGKTTVGRMLAEALGWPFLDADDFHPEANVAKMRAGTALTDDDRWPWLDRLAAEMAAINARGAHAVLACSALKQSYRDRLARAGDVRIVYLKGDRATIAPRLAARPGHYMPRVAARQPARHARGARRRDGRRHSRPRRRAGRGDPPPSRRHATDSMNEPPARPPRRQATLAAHLGREPRRFLGAVNTPVFRASTIVFPTVAELEASTRGEHPGVSYGLHGLPTVRDLQAAVAELEGGRRGVRRAVRPDGDHAAAAGAALRRRPRAGHRLGLRPDAPLLRPAPDALRRRGRLLRSAARARRSSARSGRTPGSCSPSRRGR